MTDETLPPMIPPHVQRLAVRLLAAGATALVVVLTALWFMFVDAPSPEQVCDRIIEMTYAEGATHDPESVDALVRTLREGCVTSKRQVIQYRGKIEWASYASCVMEASDLAGAEGC